MAEDVPGMRWLEGVWCAWDGSCLGVGFTPQNVGAVVVLRAGGAIGPVRPVPQTNSLGSIACVARAGCTAVGQGAGSGVVVEVSRDGTPGASRAVPGTTELLDVACPTATTCLATGHRRTPISSYPYSRSSPVFVVISNGQPGPAQPLPRGSGAAVGIACPDSTTCVTISSTAFVVLRQADGAWSPTSHWISSGTGTGYPTYEISCPSSTACFTTAAGFLPSGGGYRGVPAMMEVSPDGSAGPVQIIGEGSGLVHNISCRSEATCTLVGQDTSGGVGLVIDVVDGRPAAARSWAGSNFFTGVSCVAVASCGLVGNAPGGAVFGWHGPVPA